jgi:hypothetical protein
MKGLTKKNKMKGLTKKKSRAANLKKQTRPPPKKFGSAKRKTEPPKSINNTGL